MHKPKRYKCPVCGAEVPNLPMPVLKLQRSHVKRRSYVDNHREPNQSDRRHRQLVVTYVLHDGV
jgi:hypothetical protein